MKIIQIIDDKTGRGLFEDETKELGVFPSIADAEVALGSDFVRRFCLIRTV